jgi:hypothetical protein
VKRGLCARRDAQARCRDAGPGGVAARPEQQPEEARGRESGAAPRPARERGDAEAINLWAGQAYELAPRDEPAGEIVRRLSAEARAALREALWERAFPGSTPTAGLDPRQLAAIDMPGGGIAAVALSAAYLAADAGGPVDADRLRVAARWELAKTGRSLGRFK